MIYPTIWDVVLSEHVEKTMEKLPRSSQVSSYGSPFSDVLIRIVTLREMQKSIPLFSPKQVDVIEPGNAWGVPGSKSLGVEWSGYSLVI